MSLGFTFTIILFTICRVISNVKLQPRCKHQMWLWSLITA
jgi:hypothetical protein